MKKVCIFLLVFLGVCIEIQAQRIAVKTNLLYDAIATPNLGAEVAFSDRLTLEASGYYNGWTLSNQKSFKHWMVQPELRYWIHERFNGHFFGLHAQYMDYDFAGLRMIYGMKKDRVYEGNAYGGGVSYGYQLYLSPRWNLEFTAGFGFVRFKYDKYPFPKEGGPIGKFRNDYWGPTKLGVSIVYIIK